jgi:hypothetical protein
MARPPRPRPNQPPPPDPPGDGDPPRRRPPRRPRPPRAQPRRSQVGALAAAAIAVASAGGVGVGLNSSGHPPFAGPVVAASGPTCGGVERWAVKVANDPGAAAIDPNPRAMTIAQMNALTPGPLDAPSGRMAVERAQYTVKGFLAFFKHEDDGDYHVVLTDETNAMATGSAPPTGHSMVVELPNLDCLSGKHGMGPHTSPLGPAMAEALQVFEAQAKHINGAHIPPKSIPVTVTGVGFFDFDHGQKGRGVPHPGVDGQMKVIELHPVTAFTFDTLGEPD